MKLFLKDNGKESGAVQPKAAKKTKKAIDPLIITVQNAVSQLSEANEQTGKLVDSVILHLSRSTPMPVVTMEAPVITIPPYPEVEPPMEWEVTVTSRDAKDLIKNATLKRIK
ncbi:MAG: hypothetical protein JRI94_00395 [Deltaproteobacteria bacterium]|nr:hypothetical protein [Deltaproteobacteria bacterium]